MQCGPLEREVVTPPPALIKHSGRPFVVSPLPPNDPEVALARISMRAWLWLDAHPSPSSQAVAALNDSLLSDEMDRTQVELSAHHGAATVGATFWAIVEELREAVANDGPRAAGGGEPWDSLRTAVRRFHDKTSYLWNVVADKSSVWYSGQWYSAATDRSKHGQLTSDRLRKTPKLPDWAKRKSKPRELQFEFTAVCGAFPDHADDLERYRLRSAHAEKPGV
jgi:hypothetical protein